MADSRWHIPKSKLQKNRESKIMMVVHQSRWLEVEGGKVHYLIEGHEGGRPVVLLHGASSQAETWKEIGTMAAPRSRPTCWWARCRRAARWASPVAATPPT